MSKAIAFLVFALSVYAMYWVGCQIVEARKDTSPRKPITNEQIILVTVFLFVPPIVCIVSLMVLMR